MKLESIEDEVTKLPLVESIEDLHNLLQNRHCDYNRVDRLWYYVVEFVDSATDSILFCSCYDSPVLALRELPAIIEKTKSSADKVSIELRFALPKSSAGSEDCEIFHNVYLSPYLYFNRHTESSVDSETTEEKDNN